MGEPHAMTLPEPPNSLRAHKWGYHPERKTFFENCYGVRVNRNYINALCVPAATAVVEVAATIVFGRSQCYNFATYSQGEYRGHFFDIIVERFKGPSTFVP